MTILSTLLALTLTLPPQSNDFTDGQLVLLDPTLDSGIAMIDPLSGAISEPYSLHDVPFSFDVLCYDPYRERILFPATPLPGDPRVLLSGDAQGNFDVIGFPDTPCQALAPVGDGRVYFRLQEDPINALRVLDANDQVSIVADGNGQPYTPPINGGWFHMEYHPASNSLVHASGSFLAPCGTPQHISVRRFDLSPDGNQVVGDACVSFEVDPSGGCRPTGLSRLDADSMILTVDSNSNADQPRLLRVQVEPLVVSAYTSFGYAGAAATNAGTYSRLRNQAVIYDTANNALRAYSPGQGGEGFLVTPADSLGPIGGAGQTANLTEVNTQATVIGLLTAEPQVIGVVHGGTVMLQLEAGPTAAAKLHVVLGSLTGVSPGVPIDGPTLPLVPDAYFALTLSGNSPVANAVGLLDDQGAASASLSVGPLSANFVGLVAQHAAVILDPVTLAITDVSNPVAVPFI